MSDKDYCIRFRPENLKDGEEVEIDGYKGIVKRN